jgi:hypothetical protein
MNFFFTHRFGQGVLWKYLCDPRLYLTLFFVQNSFHERSTVDRKPHICFFRTSLIMIIIINDNIKIPKGFSVKKNFRNFITL